MQRSVQSVEWEMFQDPAHFDMWAVRPVGDHVFNSPRLFHFAKEDQARRFLSLLRLSPHAAPQVEN